MLRYKRKHVFKTHPKPHKKAAHQHRRQVDTTVPIADWNCWATLDWTKLHSAPMESSRAPLSSYTVPLTRCRVLLYLMDSTSRATVSVSQLVVLLIMNCSMKMMLVGQQFQPSINILKEGSNK
jgi:hypothetical protein